MNATNGTDVFHNLIARLDSANHGDSLYTSDIYLGNPPQKLRALFDTGSQNTWVLSKSTQVNTNGIFHNYYDQSKSVTAQNMSLNTTHATFGTGKLSGHFITDDLRIGLNDDNVNGVGGNSLTWTAAKNSTNPMLIPGYHIGIVDSQEGIFDKFNVDALVGMSYIYHTIGVKPFLNQLIEKKLLK